MATAPSGFCTLFARLPHALTAYILYEPAYSLKSTDLRSTPTAAGPFELVPLVCAGAVVPQHDLATGCEAGTVVPQHDFAVGTLVPQHDLFCSLSSVVL